MQKKFHTPDGVRDIYNGECQKKQFLEKKLSRVLSLYGYRFIETPSIEFFDVFASEVGTTPSKELYKFFDKEGNTLVLRPDFTPSIARAAAMYFQNESMPIRLCYRGNTFVNNSNYQGRLKETTQVGMELLGDASVQGDGEAVAMAVEMLKSCGLEDFQISIGQVDFFKALVEEAGLEKETTERLRSLIVNKNYFGVEELILGLDLREDLKTAFIKFPRLFGTMEICREAKELTQNEQALAAIEGLERLWEILSVYGCQDYVTFDLGMLSKYNYYTGIIFQAYTMGLGEAVLKGGRYDNLLGHFGKAFPAIGFAIGVDDLANALSRQGISHDIKEAKCLILYDEESQAEAIGLAKKMRQDGILTELLIKEKEKKSEDYKSYARAVKAQTIFLLEGAEQTVIDLMEGEGR